MIVETSAVELDKSGAVSGADVEVSVTGSVKAVVVSGSGVVGVVVEISDCGFNKSGVVVASVEEACPSKTCSGVVVASEGVVVASVSSMREAGADSSVVVAISTVGVVVALFNPLFKLISN